MRRGADHRAAAGRHATVARRIGKERCAAPSGAVREPRRAGGRWYGCGRPQGALERLPLPASLDGGGRRMMRNERGSAGDDQRRSRECRGRERHGGKRRGPAPVALPRAIAAPIHQRCNIESCIRIAIRQRSAIPAFRFGPLAASFEEHAEVERGAGVPGSGRLPVRNGAVARSPRCSSNRPSLNLSSAACSSRPST